MNEVINYVPGKHLKPGEYEITESFLKNDKVIIYFNDTVDITLNEGSENNNKLRSLLYSERMKGNKQILQLYRTHNIPWAKYKYVNLNMYKSRNLVTDLSYYIDIFMKNNFYKYDKGIDLLFDFINRYLKDTRYDSNGYIKKTVYIPVNTWCDIKDRFWDYSKHVNIISLIYRYTKENPAKLKNAWKDYVFIFCGDNGYFKVDFETFDSTKLPKFLNNIKTLLNNSDIRDDINKASTNSIIDDIVDKADGKGIKINNLTGTNDVKVDNKTLERVIKPSKDEDPKDRKPEIEYKKDAFVDSVAQAAENSDSTEEAIKKLDKSTYASNILNDLAKQAEDHPDITVTRTAKNNENIYKTKFDDGKTISQILNDDTPDDKPIPVSDFNINTINTEWNDLTYINFGKAYDLDSDIIKIIYSFSENKTNPISILDIDKTDTSDSENHKYTYTVKCRTPEHKNFTLKFDIPKFKNDRFMKLKGNEKTMNGQLILLPIIKTDQDTAQIVSNYNKIFIKRYGSTAGKSYPTADKIIKALSKIDKNNSPIKVVVGDNTNICSKYELPYDYIDIASVYSTIEINNIIFYLNQDTIRDTYKDIINLNNGIPIAYDKKAKSIMYLKPGELFSLTLKDKLFVDNSFKEAYNKANRSTKYTYSKASILNTEIPIIVIIGYNVGLQKAMDLAKINFSFEKSRNNMDEYTDYIKFNDGYLVYELTPDSSLLMNGLKECDTDNYSLKDINNKDMWIDFLDNFGGRIKADGLDNFYDLMMDPITVEVCKKYQLPTTYIEALIYANLLLSDNKYNKHIDINGNRLRTNELVAAYTYRALARSYAEYSNKTKRNPGNTMTIRQQQIIDDILTDSITSDLSILNPLLEIESSNTISFKGPSGMNSDRSYSLDKRTYDESMLNVLGMSTGFAANVGINRYATMDANIEGSRGYIKSSTKKDLNAAKTLTAVEAMTPFGTTGDDPFRTAMTFVQTAKHLMRTNKSDPLLVTNGADRAIPYMISDTFVNKAKTSGEVTELNDDYMIVSYSDGTKDFIDLRSTVKKNSDGGMYVTIKLDPLNGLKKGSKVKPNQILAYDPLSFNNDIGYDDALSCDIGTLAKVAIMQTDEGYEDSAIISEWLSEAMSSDIVVEKEVVIPKNANIYSMVKKGQPVQEGDTLIIFQNAFDEKDYNILLKNLAEDEDEEITDLGRIPIRSKITGVVEDIQILRTVDISEMSPSLQKTVKSYESNVEKMKKIAKQCDNEKDLDMPANTIMEPTGRLKGARDAVLIKFYLKYKDKMAVGDKLVYYSALKGTTKSIFELDKEPYTDFRPEEKIHALIPVQGVTGRMVTSVKKIGVLNKIMIELDRKVKDIMGIKWETLDK